MTALERIMRARESMEEATILTREKMGNKAVLTKYYHAMMNCLFAVFDIQDMGRLTHADIIDRFEREYVITGKTERADLEILRRAYDLTHECDCDHMPVPTDKDIENARRGAENLMQSVGDCLGIEVKGT
jgi:uncharacterized protein (UPF0332 family)